MIRGATYSTAASRKVSEALRCAAPAHCASALTRQPVDWAKTNYKLSFHKSAGSDDDQFLWAADVPAVKSIEMHGFFQESGPNSYMRKARPQRVALIVNDSLPGTLRRSQCVS